MQKKLNEDFIEEYSELFAKQVCDDFFSTKSHISGQEILTITPSKQVNFFVIKLLFGNWQEESQRLESPFFDYSASDVKEAMLKFMNVLSRHISVGRQEFEILLQDAVRDTLFFIMAPNVFMEIEMDRKGTETLTEKSSSNLIKYLKIEKEKFSENIQKFVGADRDDIELDESIITDEVLEREVSFLNQVTPISRLKLEDGEDGEDVPVIAEEKAPAPIESPQQEEEVPPAENLEIPGEQVEDQKATEPAEVAQDIITNLDPDEEDEDDEDAILNSKFEDPMVGSTIAESHQKTTDSLLNAISLNHRYMFINELFDGEADLFAQALEKVEKSNSFDDSVEVLVQNYAKEFHWDMNSDEVKELLKIIFRRFR